MSTIQRVISLLILIQAYLCEDFYKILGIDHEATEKDMKKAFRRLSVKYHPDKNPGDSQAQEMFIKINKAYETLADPEKRKIYDLYGEEGLSKEHNLQTQNKPKGQNAMVDITVDLEELYNGATKEINLQKNVVCSKCHGTGGKLGKTKQCPKCHGRGQVIENVDTGMGFTFKMQNTCNKCGGKGIVFKEVCEHCKGRRVVREDKNLRIEIERGMKDNEKIVFPREAEQHPDIVPGDLVVTLKQRAHSFFTKRQGDDLHASISLNFKEALLGYDRSFKHLDGRRVSVTSQRPIQPFAVRTLHGEGMPMHNFSSSKGNLFLKQIVRLPERLTSDERILVERLFAE